MNKEELEVILRHEKYHLEHRDALTLLLATVVESLFPFFPIFSDFVKVYRTDREVKADQAAIRGAFDKRLLSEVLKKLLQYEPIVNPAFIPGIISVDTLEARIQSLLSLKTSYKILSRRNLLISLTSLIALVGLMVTPVNAVELHEDGHDVVILCSQTSSCESVCREHTLMQLQSSRPLYSPVNFTSVK
jgi:beta-lactamase regulating signal transducer with metallopeptidase domain